MGYTESPPWCHRHSRVVWECNSDKCVQNADNLHYADPNFDKPLSVDAPDFGFGPVDAAAIEFFNIYETNVRAGFTPPQALYVLAVQITGNPGIAPGLDLPEGPTDV